MKKLLKYVIPSLFMTTVCFADKVKLLEKNEEGLQARADLIQNAKREIFVEYYEVASDSLSMTGLALLGQAAKRGVHVKILIDNMHNSLTDPEMAAVLGISDSAEANKNIEIKVFNPLHTLNPLHLTYRNHDKLMNVDGEMMIIGGRNMAKNYFGKSKEFNFKDADALIQGTAAAESKEYFIQLWEKNPEVKSVYLNNIQPAKIAEAKLKMDKYLETFHAGNAWVKTQPLNEMLNDLEDVPSVHFAFNDPEKSMTKVENKLSAQIMKSLAGNAKKSILITTPSLYPTVEELETLEKLAANGVQIKIVTNSLASTDVTIGYAAFLTIKQRLIDMGAELYLYKGPEVLHCKGVVIDGKISMIGSFNFNRRSSVINREIGVRIGSANDSESSIFTKDFMKFINEEIIQNSILLAKDKVEFSTDSIDAPVADEKKQKLQSDKILVNFLGNQI